MNDGFHWTVKGVADYLGMKAQSVYNLVHQGKIPFHKVGAKGLRFKKSEIDYWLYARNKRNPDDSPYIMVEGYPRINLLNQNDKGWFTEMEMIGVIEYQYTSDMIHNLVCEKALKRFQNVSQETAKIITNRVVIPSAWVQNIEKFTIADICQVTDLLFIAGLTDSVPGLCYAGQDVESPSYDEKIIWNESLDFYSALSEAVKHNIDGIPFAPCNTMTEAERLFSKMKLEQVFLRAIKNIGLYFSGHYNSKKPAGDIGNYPDFISFLKPFMAGYVCYGTDSHVEAYLQGESDLMRSKKLAINGLAPDQLKTAIDANFFLEGELAGVLEANIKELESRVMELKKISQALRGKK
ncbi:MAG: helix-turn-helix domain-containing protein [Mangrovibacterium sp.]